MIPYLFCFGKVKAKHLKATAEVLVSQFHSDIPNNLKELMALPGVGPKMAHICMDTAWGEVTGIGMLSLKSLSYIRSFFTFSSSNT